MRAIHEVNPLAELVQTEDAGSTCSTPEIAAQAIFENDRRWVSPDLISGRVTPDDPLWCPPRGAMASAGCSSTTCVRRLSVSTVPR
jgi:hypothetical protein